MQRIRVLATLCLVTRLVPGRSLPAQSVPEWRFTEELRIGSERDDPTGFSDVRGVLADRKGNIWVLEASTQEIRVFDPAGKHLRNVGRKGQGPGEFIYADGMALAPDGLIWVHDPQNARFSIFDQDGKFVRQQLAVANGYGYVWVGGIDRHGRIWDQLLIRDPNDPQSLRMRRAVPDWSKVDTLRMPRCSSPGTQPEASAFKLPHGYAGIPFFPGPIYAIDYYAGAVWCGPTSAEYRLSKIGVEPRDTLVRIVRSVAALPVTGDEREAAIAKIKEFMKKVGDNVSLDWSRIPKSKPILQNAFVDQDGRLWVRRTSLDKQADFDLYSAEGKPLATLRIGMPVKDYPHALVRGGTAYLISQEEGEIPYIVRGRFGPARP
ncbi:MAG TPA: 6-bladed beta-propeller [Gemmatimonadales bacterium]|jgi:hypothetical protein|nr:6-bladed beta-propeller [Gemmatimonadales bacterium]